MLTVTQLELDTVVCTCGMTYAVPQILHSQAKEKGKTVYCPAGHSWYYIKSEVSKLREQVADLEQQRSQMVTENDKLTRKLERVRKGVCPHCNRFFSNLCRHMKAKH